MPSPTVRQTQDRAGTKLTGGPSGGKVQKFYGPNPPVFLPPGTVVASEGTEGQGAQKTLPQVGGSWAQVNTIQQWLQDATEGQKPALWNLSWTQTLF